MQTKEGGGKYLKKGLILGEDNKSEALNQEQEWLLGLATKDSLSKRVQLVETGNKGTNQWLGVHC